MMNYARLHRMLGLIAAAAALSGTYVGCSAQTKGGSAESGTLAPLELKYRAILGIPDYLEVPSVPSFNPPTPQKIALGEVILRGTSFRKSKSVLLELSPSAVCLRRR